MTHAIKDDQEPFNSIGLIPLESFYGSEIKLMGELGKRLQPWSQRRKTGEKMRIMHEAKTLLQIAVRDIS